MKLIKLLTVVFIFSIIFLVSGVKADNGAFMGWNNISIPAANVVSFNSDQITKGYETEQNLDTTRTDGSIEARTQGMVAGVSSSSWKTVKTGKIYFGSASTSTGLQRLQIRHTSFWALPSAYWGIWTYDWPV